MTPRVLAASVLTTLGLAAAAQATVGAGISAAPVTLGSTKATPGRTYVISFAIQNTGTEKARYALRVERFPGARGRAVPARWVRFFVARPTLRAGELKPVRAQLRIPRGARAGAYAGLIVLAGAPTGRSGASPGAAASTALSFRVAGRARSTRR